ncbi:uncharacterized protein METZ01_LOCUS175330, partial [marine metagenome]
MPFFVKYAINARSKSFIGKIYLTITKSTHHPTNKKPYEG